MWYGGMDDDDEMGMRADNPIWVAAESVLSRMPLAADVREAAEIVATASDDKADVEPSVDNDEATDVESAEEQDSAINETQQDALDGTAQQVADVEAAGAEPDKQQAAAGGGEEVALTAVRLRLRPPLLRRCGTPGCELADHHKGPHSNQLPVGPRQRKKKPPPLPGWRAVRYAAPAGRDERHFKHIQTGWYARGATEMSRMEEELRNLAVGWSSWFGCGKRTREEEGGGGSTRDDLTDPDDNDCDSSEDWEPGSGSGSMHGSQRKHPRRGEASSPASETSEVTEAKCGVCLWDDCEAGNEILLCDGPSCVAAFHQKCAALYASQHTSHSICAKALATAPYPGACPRPSTACLRASGSAPLASSQRA